jgi:hypothetical protein
MHCISTQGQNTSTQDCCHDKTSYDSRCGHSNSKQHLQSKKKETDSSWQQLFPGDIYDDKCI